MGEVMGGEMNGFSGLIMIREERGGVRYGCIMTERAHRWMNIGELREIDESGRVCARVRA